MHRLNHDNRIIHNHTNREHQCKEGEEVDTEIEEEEEHKCSDNRHEGGNERNHCRAEVTQEEEHHECYQYDSLQEGAHHIVDRGVEEVVGTLQDNHLHINREIILCLFEECVDSVNNLGSIRVGSLIDYELCARATINLTLILVRLITQLDSCNILQTQHLTVW